MTQQSLLKSYPAIGKCIYCGATEYRRGSTRKLGDEHIVPEGLGGRAVLPEASCEDCERKINGFEQPIIRGTYQVARKQMGVRSKKRGKPKPEKRVNVRIKTLGEEKILPIPVQDYPGLIVTLTFQEPRILSRKDKSPEKISGGVAVAMLPFFGERLNAALGMPITMFPGTISIDPIRHDADATKLARFVAKIAHAYAVAELGADTFQPYLQPLILGQAQDFLSHYIGGTYDEKLAPTSQTFDLALEIRRDAVGEEHWVCSVRLYSHFSGMPRYLAVVGKRL